jgi:hypothetical protein
VLEEFKLGRTAPPMWRMWREPAAPATDGREAAEPATDGQAGSA